MRLEQYQTEGDFHEQRNQFRAEALEGLREREGLPKPELIDGKMMYLGSDGKHHSTAIGKLKQPNHEEMDEFWSGPEALHFHVEEISRDGVHIDTELRDLERDAQLVRETQGVSYGDDSEPNPEMKLDSLDDESVDAAIQKLVAEG